MLHHLLQYAAKRFASFATHNVRFTLQSPSTRTPVVPALRHATAQISIIVVSSDAMTHYSSHFFAEIDVLAKLDCVTKQKFVGHHDLFARKKWE
jgi:hypothetical protein